MVLKPSSDGCDAYGTTVQVDRAGGDRHCVNWRYFSNGYEWKQMKGGATTCLRPPTGATIAMKAASGGTLSL